MPMIILTIAANLLGLLATLVMIVMFLAGGANANAKAIRQIKWLIASVVFVQVVSVALSVGLVIGQRSWLAVGAGVLPVVFAVVLVVVLVRLEW